MSNIQDRKSHLQVRYFYLHFQEFKCLTNVLVFSLVFWVPDISKAILQFASYVASCGGFVDYRV